MHTAKILRFMKALLHTSSLGYVSSLILLQGRKLTIEIVPQWKGMEEAGLTPQIEGAKGKAYGIFWFPVRSSFRLRPSYI